MVVVTEDESPPATLLRREGGAGIATAVGMVVMARKGVGENQEPRRVAGLVPYRPSQDGRTASQAGRA